MLFRRQRAALASLGVAGALVLAAACVPSNNNNGVDLAACTQLAACCMELPEESRTACSTSAENDLPADCAGALSAFQSENMCASDGGVSLTVSGLPSGAVAIPSSFVVPSGLENCDGDVYFLDTTDLCVGGVTYLLCYDGAVRDYDCEPPGLGWTPSSELTTGDASFSSTVSVSATATSGSSDSTDTSGSTDTSNTDETSGGTDTESSTGASYPDDAGEYGDAGDEGYGDAG